MLRMTISVLHGAAECLLKRCCLALIVVSHERRTNSRCPKLSRATSAPSPPYSSPLARRAFLHYGPQYSNNAD
ncbi:hypothetical protein E2C01_098571 [Portunus trituberculatus]|uniref:Uncharacterized protein n=1 Tax=Portunus trituberculatus TaxID=210409 RepID=A0A5B7JY62_PORTR|nr:hypothetical protein [Portunus trituberculatus]